MRGRRHPRSALRRGGEAICREERSTPHRSGPGRLLPDAAHALQGPAAGGVQDRTAEDQCRQDLAPAVARGVAEDRHSGCVKRARRLVTWRSNAMVRQNLDLGFLRRSDMLPLGIARIDFEAKWAHEAFIEQTKSLTLRNDAKLWLLPR